ncbi:MAG: isoprenylcysteine carboxylmethyltransferase family protein [Nitrospinae bacterium]|nr:isoprenylcysteine carboxylmethyltransferase family protein [Nitrospinota bacterium]
MSAPEPLSPNQRRALSVLIPSLYLFPLVVAYVLPKHFGFGSRPLAYLGFAVGISGLCLWILAMAQLGRGLAVLPGDTKDRLVTRGVYKFVRHPIYVGIVLTLLGLFLACGSVFGLVYLVAVVVPLNLVRARLEDKALLERFGDSYRAYRQRTLF